MKGMVFVKKNRFISIALICAFFCMRFFAIPFCAQGQEYPSIEEDTPVTATFQEEGDKAYFQFVATKTTTYAFYSISEFDTFGRVYDASFTEIVKNDEGGDGSNFKVLFSAVEGETYFVSAEYYWDDSVEPFTVCITEHPRIDTISIEKQPNRIEYVQGYARENLDLEGLQLNLHWSTGKDQLWTYGEDSQEFEEYAIRFDSSYLEEYGVVLISTDWSWCLLYVQFVPSPISSLEIVEPSSIEYRELYNGEYQEDEEGVSYFHYKESFPNDAKVRVHYTDGSSKVVTVGEGVDGNRFSWETHQETNHWIASQTEEQTEIPTTLSLLGTSVTLPIVLHSSEIKELTLIHPTSHVFVENQYGQEIEEDEGDNYYFYHVRNLSDAEIEIVYKDGTRKTAHPGDLVEGEPVVLSDDQEINHWVIGQENYVWISYLDKRVKMPITLIENPVERIEITKAPTKVYAFRNPKDGQCWEDGKYSIYPYVLDGLELTVYYTNSDPVIFTAQDIDENGCLMGYELETIGYPVQIGGAGTISVTLSYLGATDSYNASVVTMYDINLDGESDLKDVLFLRRYLLGMEESLSCEMADFDQNQIVDMLDVLLLCKALM